jgi:hypothetical protein
MSLADLGTRAETLDFKTNVFQDARFKAKRA